MSNSKPILFTAEMVNALLDGRKTQTRRVVKFKYLHPIDKIWERKSLGSCMWQIEGKGGRINFVNEIKCPYGKVGDLLWVRETTQADHESCDSVVLSKYVADNAPVLYSNCEDEEYNDSVAHWDFKHDKKPSIFMPKWASRITLEITNIRVERLQDITVGDAIAEGCSGGKYAHHISEPERVDYKELWKSINGKDSWEDNPFVWVLEFEVIKQNFLEL